MNLPEGTQFCQEHNGKMSSLVCLDKPCKAKATLCTLCFKEKHLVCNSNLIIALMEIKNKIIFLEPNTNRGQFRNTLMTLAKAHKQAFIKRFDIWLECLLRTVDQISHEDLLNPVIMEMIKSSFNITLKEEQMKVELSSKIDRCSKKKLRQLLKTIDERMEFILNDSMIKIEELGKAINELVTTDDQKEVITEDTYTKIENLKVSVNEIRIKNQELEEALKIEKNKVKDLETIIQENDQNIKSSFLAVKIEHETKLDGYKTLLNGCNTKIGDLEEVLNDDKQLYMKVKPFVLQNTLLDWSYDPQFAAVMDGNSVFFKKKENVDSWYWIVYIVPLVRHSKFKITFKSIDEQNRHLRIYLYDRNNNPATLTYFNHGIHSSVNYHGYNSMSGLTGKTPTNSRSDPKGFDTGKEYFVEFWPGDKVRYYNEEGTLDLKGSFQGKTGPFHLAFYHIYHKVSFTVERLF